jgi:hypothetical protein
MPIRLYNEIEINCTAEKLFNYVAQPWRWHEWHPDSKGARADKSILATGDHFDETIAVQPLAPLPLTITRYPHYVVRESVPHTRWMVEGTYSDGWLSFQYDIEPRGERALFKRTVQFEVRGAMRLLVPLVKMKQERKSLVALAALKRKLESM